MNAEVLLYKSILHSLRYKYPTHIKRFYDIGQGWWPFIDISKVLYDDIDLCKLASIVGINPIIFSALLSHIQGLWFFPWYIYDFEDIVPDSLDFIKQQSKSIINTSSLLLDEDIFISQIHDFIMNFANIPSIKLLENQIELIRQLPYGIMWCNSHYDWKFFSYRSVGEYLDVVYVTFLEIDRILGPERASHFITNIDTVTPDGYREVSYDMIHPLSEDIVHVGSIQVDSKIYTLNFFLLNSYLPWWLSFGIGLQLPDKDNKLHDDTKIYIVNVLFEPWLNGGKTKAVITTIQQACRHIYFQELEESIKLYYSTSANATLEESSINDNSYIKTLLNKAVMDAFIDRHGQGILMQLINDHIHKQVLNWTIDSKSANQPGFIDRMAQKQYNEYLRWSYDPTILLTALVSYVLSYQYDVYIISPEENLRSLYHIEDFNLWKVRSEKTYTYRAELLWWVKQSDGRFLMPFDKVSAFLSDRNDWLGIYDISKIMDWRNRVFAWTNLDMDIIQKDYSTLYDHDTIESMAITKESTIKLVNRFSF